MTSARAALDRLLGGAPYAGDFLPFVRDGRPDPDALGLLSAALREVEGEPRAEVARALLAVVERTDPLWQEGGIVVRDPKVVDTLVRAGPLHLDGAKELCYEALLYAVPRPLLLPHAAALVDDLRRNPDATTFLIVSRLQDPRALPVLERIFADEPSWITSAEASAAAAAYGDVLTELSALERFEATTNPYEKSDLAIRLGWIGTPRCLRALGEALRTPLVQDDKVYIRRSCRVDVLFGLRTVFTDAVPLFENRFTSDAAYEAAERFVTAQLGVTWTAPRPPFLFKEVLPH